MPKKSGKSSGEDDKVLSSRRKNPKANQSKKGLDIKQGWNVRILILLIIILILAAATAFYSSFTGYEVALDKSTVKFLRGDANQDGRVDVSDTGFIDNYLSASGSAPACMDAVDANDDGLVNIADSEYILDFRFSGGPAPPAPYPDIGLDPTVDSLGCKSYNPVPPPTPEEALQQGGGGGFIDFDGDGVDLFEEDNCPDKPNPDQADADGDGVGNACDYCSPGQPDRDKDGWCDSLDNCPLIWNPQQTTRDADDIGTPCDAGEQDTLMLVNVSVQPVSRNLTLKNVTNARIINSSNITVLHSLNITIINSIGVTITNSTNVTVINARNVTVTRSRNIWIQKAINITVIKTTNFKVLNKNNVRKIGK